MVGCCHVVTVASASQSFCPHCIHAKTHMSNTTSEDFPSNSICCNLQDLNLLYTYTRLSCVHAYIHKLSPCNHSNRKSKGGLFQMLLFLRTSQRDCLPYHHGTVSLCISLSPLYVYLTHSQRGKK